MAGGRTIGATTDGLDGAKIDLSSGKPDPSGKPLLYANFAAGLLELAGVDPGEHIPGAEALHALSA